MRAVSLAAGAMEALLPAICPACSGPLPAGSRGLCPACWSLVVPDPAARCPRCGMLWEGAGSCPACREAPPPQVRTLVWGEHDGLLRRAVLLAKHGGRDELAGPLARRLAAAVSGRGLERGADLVCEVPTHPLRAMFRGAILARELASALARRLGLPRAAVLRRRGLARQAGRTRSARRRLPAGAFRASGRVRGLHVLLVDDVMTTGTTLRRAAAALLRSGAASVRCAVLAAAPDPRRLP